MIRIWTHISNGTVWYPFCVLWSSITGFRPENVSYKLPILQVVKLQPYLDYFQNTYSKMKTNIRLWMYTPNGNVWYPLCLLWSSISCFRPENISYKLAILQVVKLITTIPRLCSENLFQNENQHQIMNVHTKWNGLIPILSALVKYYLFQAWKQLQVANSTSIPRLFSGHLLQNENQHQIMNVHIKWNCLIPILSTLVKYYWFQAWKR